jgi:hypothetical protein
MKQKMFLLIMLVAWFLPLSADIIYDQTGRIVGGDGFLFSYNDYFIGQDFTVPAGEWTVDNITINASGYHSMYGPVSTINYKFYEDAGGIPGNLIFEGSQSGIFEGVVVPGFEPKYMDYTFNVDGVSLSSGMYWLGLNIPYPTLDFRWTGVRPIVNNPACISVDNGVTYLAYFNTDFMFRIDAHTASVPEPSTPVLLLLGCIGLSILPIRRKLSRVRS